MGQVTVSFNNQEHHLACQDGGEERLGMLADYIEERAQSLVDRMGPVGDARLLLMTAIMIADELHDANGGELPSNAASEAEVKRMDVAMGKAVLRIEELARNLEV
ncbi:MAG: cell division protein ZapA [Kordiimonadaceae bacterium]|jgi:cell division protein ZapA|nr:cell division protein ZapA [Kordiimonadaceae bacterium]MBT6032183.1 cell division protein ZapA [Kordiimonadaceae bacterium]